ncbi:hypothetical protein H5410_046295 [Solanum commersonii]|uniref:Uncharacterized protein n=1 Tax=Solanum commersonii TaxID=4109 RepID=A0A9J5XDY7_SOLCO|nr:hypothetical protein H5410_046295 [Solanum commersonii]
MGCLCRGSSMRSTLEVGAYPSSILSLIDKDNIPPQMVYERRMVPAFTKGKEKVNKKLLKRGLYGLSPKTHGDAYEVQRKLHEKNRREGNRGIGLEMPTPDVIDVSIEVSESMNVWEKTLPRKTILDSLVSHQVSCSTWEEARESYYNIEFAYDGSINTRVGDKSLHPDEDLFGTITEVPRRD